MSGECSNCESRQRRGNDPRCLVCIYFNPAIFNKGFTEKENHTGIGLWEVRKILSKNNNITIFKIPFEEFKSTKLYNTIKR